MNKRQGRVFAVVIVAALGLMAMMASAASAVWLENGSAITSDKEVEVSHDTSHGVLDVPSKNLEILCKTLKGDKLFLKKESSEAEGAVEFSECVVYNNKVLQTNCSVDNVLAGGKANLIVHNGKTYVLLRPTTGLEGTFSTVLFLGELCALPEKNRVFGTVVLECLTEELKEKDCLTAAKYQLLREAPNQALYKEANPKSTVEHGLKYGLGGGVSANLLGVGKANLASGATSWAGHL